MKVAFNALQTTFDTVTTILDAADWCALRDAPRGDVVKDAEDQAALYKAREWIRLSIMSSNLNGGPPKVIMAAKIKPPVVSRGAFCWVMAVKKVRSSGGEFNGEIAQLVF